MTTGDHHEARTKIAEQFFAEMTRARQGASGTPTAEQAPRPSERRDDPAPRTRGSGG